MSRPVIGITCDTVAGHSPQKWKYESPHPYAQSIVAAGGTPLLLPYETDCIGHYLDLCNGFILSGGDDPDTAAFGEPVHPQARVIHPQRQAFETALLAALDPAPHPVLGVCLGMQLMALHHGGQLHQHMPDAPDIGAQRAAAHDRREHPLQTVPDAPAWLATGSTVYSRHHQAVAHPGRLSILAHYDGVVEAIGRPTADRFYLGVQWHPECTGDAVLGAGLIRRLVEACR
jgi:putative glutamine amidotransferase